MKHAGTTIALPLLVYLAYRGVSALILTPAVALLAVLFTCGTLLGSF